MIKFHVEHTASLCRRAKLCCISEHFGQRNQRTNCLCIAGANFHTLNQTAAAVDLSHHIAEIFFRDNHLNLHHWFEQNGTTALNTFLETHGSSQLKCHFTRVNFMKRTVKQGYFEVNYRITGEHTAFRSLFYTL